jgi:hypothetical protein
MTLMRTNSAPPDEHAGGNGMRNMLYLDKPNQNQVSFFNLI